jgi:hypothetical protein
MLAFVTVTCWQRFQRIDISQQDEALADLYSMTRTYPDPPRTAVEQGIRRYVSDVTQANEATTGPKLI